MSGERINSIVTASQSYGDSDCGLLKPPTADQQTGEGNGVPMTKLDAHVVLLNNYVRPHHVCPCIDGVAVGADGAGSGLATSVGWS